MWLIWRPRDWLNVTDGPQRVIIASSSSDDK